jgi:hypothetical protein
MPPVEDPAGAVAPGPGPAAPHHRLDLVPPVGTRLVGRARRASEMAAMCTPFVAILALWTSMSQLEHARREARTRPIGDILAQSTQITMWMAGYPEIARFFQRDLFAGGPRTAEDDRALLASLAGADPAVRRRVQTVCEVLADFFETTYTDRDSFDPDEWRAWWGYLQDVYRESPVLRRYLDERARWYTVDDALERPIARAEDGAAVMR